MPKNEYFLQTIDNLEVAPDTNQGYNNEKNFIFIDVCRIRHDAC
jgi:hypothetical protein